MAVKVNQDGRLISLVVARQTINGREFPIRKSVVASAGDRFPDDQLSETVIETAKAGERGLEYVEDGDEEESSSELSGSSDDEPVPGYSSLTSDEAHARYEAEEDPAVKRAILEYETSKPGRTRKWVTEEQDAGVQIS